MVERTEEEDFIGGLRTEVRGRRSEVSGQRAEVLTGNTISTLVPGFAVPG